MIKDVAIDADHILYDLASPPGKDWKTTLPGKSIGTPNIKAEVTRLKRAFKSRVDDYVTMAEIEGVVRGFKIGKIIPVISSKTNFRYRLYEAYKGNRQEREHLPQFLKLRKWARKKYSHKDAEADDVVAYHVRNGAVGFSADKDLLKGVPGIWYDTHYMRKCWQYTSPGDAERFSTLQYIMGDTGDRIPGIHGVGIVTAEKLLNEYGWGWDAIVGIYKSKGLGEYDALLTRRLIGMDQWTPEHGIRLWEPETMSKSSLRIKRKKRAKNKEKKEDK